MNLSRKNIIPTRMKKSGGVASGERPSPKQKKAEAIRPWIHPDERISVDFEDALNLNAEVVDCSAQVVTLRLEATVLDLPHYHENVVIPLRLVTISEDPTRYTRNPDAPVQYGRLKLIVKQKRPAVALSR
ncbi:MAG: hypothetical protein Nkreftii_002235 [Candidatus Nitrospira kreftii]|uniref:Uncharacterized protein n=1 Tax=Candidatus Nitrospira kreftii TaxID=2652173 RepID=A0A7S8FEY6_9BACT|nr:MAG: hypothetical protein Nkreftii_002235 [Candidatus Nitrospira kreftii]